LALLTPNEIAADSVVKAVSALQCKDLSDVCLFDVYSGKGVSEGKKSLTIKLTFQHLERTLLEDQIEKQVSRVLAELEKRFGIELR